MIGVPREPSTDADEPEGRSITSEVSDLPALVSDLPAPTEATSLTSHSHPNEEMQHNLSVLQEILNHMECALRISSACIIRSVQHEVASFQKAQTNGQDGQSAFRRIESIRDRLVTSLPTGASDARQQLQQHVEILRETQSVTVQHLAEFLAKVQQIMGKMLETMVLELQEAASQMREVSESQAAVSGPNMARVNPCGSNQAMTGSDFSTFPGSGTEMPFPASSDGWTHYPTASSDLGSNASAQSAERTEGAAQMGVSLPVNPGSVGHRELCAKPCLFFRTGACTGRDSCPFCHGEHAERRPHLDKRNRELFKGLPTNVRTQLLLQAMKCRADTIGREFADKLMEVVETAIEVQLQPNRRSGLLLRDPPKWLQFSFCSPFKSTNKRGTHSNQKNVCPESKRSLHKFICASSWLEFLCPSLSMQVLDAGFLCASWLCTCLCKFFAQATYASFSGRSAEQQQSEVFAHRPRRSPHKSQGFSVFAH